MQHVLGGLFNSLPLLIKNFLKNALKVAKKGFGWWYPLAFKIFIILNLFCYYKIVALIIKFVFKLMLININSNWIVFKNNLTKWRFFYKQIINNKFSISMLSILQWTINNIYHLQKSTQQIYFF